MELSLQPLQLGEVPGVGDHQLHVAEGVEHGGSGDQHLLAQPQDGGHGVHPLLGLQHLPGHRALVEQALDLGHPAAQHLLRPDAGGAGVGVVDKEDNSLPVGDVDAVVEVLAHLPEVGLRDASALHGNPPFRPTSAGI